MGWSDRLTWAATAAFTTERGSANVPCTSVAALAAGRGEVNIAGDIKSTDVSEAAESALKALVAPPSRPRCTGGVAATSAVRGLCCAPELTFGLLMKLERGGAGSAETGLCAAAAAAAIPPRSTWERGKKMGVVCVAALSLHNLETQCNGEDTYLY
jgi:hypothetical protein